MLLIAAALFALQSVGIWNVNTPTQIIRYLFSYRLKKSYLPPNFGTFMSVISSYSTMNIYQYFWLRHSLFRRNPIIFPICQCLPPNFNAIFQWMFPWSRQTSPMSTVAIFKIRLLDSDIGLQYFLHLLPALDFLGSTSMACPKSHFWFVLYALLWRETVKGVYPSYGSLPRLGVAIGALLMI